MYQARNTSSVQVADMPNFVTGVLGAYAYWGPKAGAQVFSMSPEGADLKFGGITVVTGVMGTILGGVALDRVGSTMTNALAICCISNVVGWVNFPAIPVPLSHLTVFSLCKHRSRAFAWVTRVTPGHVACCVVSMPCPAPPCPPFPLIAA